MKRNYLQEPTIKKLEKLFPYSVKVPHGFKTHAQSLCRKLLGQCYYRWVPRWHRVSPRELRIKTRWTADDQALWQYKDGRLYFKDEGNTSMVTMAMLSKPKKRT